MTSDKSVALYTRTSTSEKQDTAMQVSELRRYAGLRGWQVFDVYEDKGFTGTNSNRPMLKKLFADAGERKFDLVLVWKLDRFGRSLKDLITMIQNLSEIGVEFASLKDNLDLSTSQGRLMLHLLGAFAEFEASMIRMRVRAGLDHARARGQRLGRPKVRDDDKIRKLRAKGHSVRQIAKLSGVSTTAVQRSLKDVTKTS